MLTDFPPSGLSGEIVFPGAANVVPFAREGGMVNGHARQGALNHAGGRGSGG